ncbi:MAG: nitroreductase family protein [Candidatus Cloacimonas sp.]|jgi:nitroreductase|nr:nitroreductase family protein [Candidatus Cloacimonadota bacterium]
MELQVALEKRRAYRSLAPVTITNNDIEQLAKAAQLAPSCFNKQPWRFIFIRDESVLKELHSALSKGNEWIHKASMMIAVFSKKEFDCTLSDREYYLFDTGMASAILMLKATELGLVAHPIAGYNQKKAKEILGIPEDLKLITFINVGKLSDCLDESLNERQIEEEKQRPKRDELSEFIYYDKYS